MFRALLISVIAMATVTVSVPSASAQHRRHKLSRRQRLHSRWVTGVGTTYLTPSDYNTCWAASQRAVVPSRATVSLKYNACLRRSNYNVIRRHRRRRRAAIRNRCTTFANQVMMPTEYQQQSSYVSCLRRARYNYIRGYLKTVTCGHLMGKRHHRCVRRLYKNIASYGYSNAAHLTYLDNLYRTRYRGFRTRHPNHRFVKRYHSHHHARKVAHRRAVRKAEKRAIRRAIKKERRKEARRREKRAIRKAIKKERRRERRRKAVKRAIKKERRRRRHH